MRGTLQGFETNVLKRGKSFELWRKFQSSEIFVSVHNMYINLVRENAGISVGVQLPTAICSWVWKDLLHLTELRYRRPIACLFCVPYECLKTLKQFWQMVLLGKLPKSNSHPCSYCDKHNTEKSHLTRVVYVHVLPMPHVCSDGCCCNEYAVSPVCHVKGFQTRPAASSTAAGKQFLSCHHIDFLIFVFDLQTHMCTSPCTYPHSAGTHLQSYCVRSPLVPEPGRNILRLVHINWARGLIYSQPLHFTCFSLQNWNPETSQNDLCSVLSDVVTK